MLYCRHYPGGVLSLAFFGFSFLVQFCLNFFLSFFPPWVVTANLGNRWSCPSTMRRNSKLLHVMSGMGLLNTYDASTFKLNYMLKCEADTSDWRRGCCRICPPRPGPRSRRHRLTSQPQAEVKVVHQVRYGQQWQMFGVWMTCMYCSMLYRKLPENRRRWNLVVKTGFGGAIGHGKREQRAESSCLIWGGYCTSL